MKFLKINIFWCMSFFLFLNILSGSVFVSHAIQRDEEVAFRNLEGLRASFRESMWKYNIEEDKEKGASSLQQESERVLTFLLKGADERFPFFDFSSVKSEDERHQLLITETLIEAILYPSMNVSSLISYFEGIFKAIKTSREGVKDSIYERRYHYVFRNFMKTSLALLEWNDIQDKELFKQLAQEEWEKQEERAGEDDAQEEKTPHSIFFQKTLFNEGILDPSLSHPIGNITGVKDKENSQECSCLIVDSLLSQERTSIKTLELAFANVRPFTLFIENVSLFCFQKYVVQIKIGDQVHTAPLPFEGRTREYHFPRKDLSNPEHRVSILLNDSTIIEGESLEKTFTGNFFKFSVCVPFSDPIEKLSYLQYSYVLDYNFSPRIEFPKYYSPGRYYVSSSGFSDHHFYSGEISAFKSPSFSFQDRGVSLHPTEKDGVYSSKTPDSNSLGERFSGTFYPNLERIDLDRLTSLDLVSMVLSSIAEGSKKGAYPKLYQIKSKFFPSLNLPEGTFPPTITLCPSEQLDPERHVLSFLWIKRSLSSGDPYIFPARDRKDLVEKYLKAILEWGKVNTQGTQIHIWYDGMFTLEASVSNTEGVLKGLVADEGSIVPPILFRDIRTLPIVQESKDVFSPGSNGTLPLYFRVDLAKNIILSHLITKEEVPYATFADIDMNPVSKEDLFSRETLSLLERFGIVMAQGGFQGFENGFQMMSFHNRNLLEAVKHVLIDLNIHRGKTALKDGRFFSATGVQPSLSNPFSSLEQIVYDSFGQMFKYFYSLEGRAKLKLNDKIYNKEVHGFQPFGENQLQNSVLKFEGGESLSTELEWKFYPWLPVPTKLVPLPPARLQYC